MLSLMLKFGNFFTLFNPSMVQYVVGLHKFNLLS